MQGLNPFYLFQAYTVILWSLQYYWKFAVIIAITSVISVTVSVWETRRVSPRCTHKKENKIFLIYKEIQMGSGARSYMRQGFHYEEMHKYFPLI
jgi:hypothetical protein